MGLLYLLLLFLGVVCFFAAAFGATVRKINLIALGLGLVFLVPLLKQF